jgi:hypothetical protein
MNIPEELHNPRRDIGWIYRWMLSLLLGLAADRDRTFGHACVPRVGPPLEPDKPSDLTAALHTLFDFHDRHKFKGHMVLVGTHGVRHEEFDRLQERLQGSTLIPVPLYEDSSGALVKRLAILLHDAVLGLPTGNSTPHSRPASRSDSPGMMGDLRAVAPDRSGRRAAVVSRAVRRRTGDALCLRNRAQLPLGRAHLLKICDNGLMNRSEPHREVDHTSPAGKRTLMTLCPFGWSVPPELEPMQDCKTNSDG